MMAIPARSSAGNILADCWNPITARQHKVQNHSPICDKAPSLDNLVLRIWTDFHFTKQFAEAIQCSIARISDEILAKLDTQVRMNTVILHQMIFCLLRRWFLSYLLIIIFNWLLVSIMLYNLWKSLVITVWGTLLFHRTLSHCSGIIQENLFPSTSSVIAHSPLFPWT